MSKTNSGNFFEDFEIGAELVHAAPRTVTEGDQSLYIALTGDRYAQHCSAEFARAIGFERETVNDLLTFHIVFGKTVNDVSLNAVANLGYASVRFLRPVYPGDTLRTVSKVLGKKENSSGKTGVVWVRSTGTNQRGEQVLDYIRWVMVNKRDPETRTGEDAAPELKKALEPADLVVPSELDATKLETWASGGSFFFEDYEIGERIDHVDGMTIEESDHMLATRLYQNTAKVHFDQFQADKTRFKRRLIYGGHIISLARSLSYNGLENALGILGWNGGTHANPTFAGDTIYALTEVLDKQPLPGRDDLGALRLRLVGVKNWERSEGALAIKIEKDGKQVYDPRVVLDLDYWVAMPRKG